MRFFEQKPLSSHMAANNFPGREREGDNQIASLDAISEPLGDVFSSFYLGCLENKIFV
jgi:hypothetical protein